MKRDTKQIKKKTFSVSIESFVKDSEIENVTVWIKDNDGNILKHINIMSDMDRKIIWMSNDETLKEE